jgi:hypothetical protein
MPSKRQASAELYRYMSAPDMYKMSSQTTQLAALNPKVRKYYQRKGRSMFRAGAARAKDARSTFNASMAAYKKSIREAVVKKGAIRRIRDEIDKYQSMQAAISDMLVSIRFQGDVIGKGIDKKRYALNASPQRIAASSTTQNRQYQDLRENLAQQAKLLRTRQELERRQRLIAQGIVKGERMLKSLQERTYKSIETQAQSRALLEMAKRLGLPMNRTTLRGLIVAEIDAALSAP